jgi:hypothetical protein
MKRKQKLESFVFNFIMFSTWFLTSNQFSWIIIGRAFKKLAKVYDVFIIFNPFLYPIGYLMNKFRGIVA